VWGLVLARCWALRNQARDALLVGRTVGSGRLVGWGWIVLVPPVPGPSAVWGGVGWVGVVFGKWIVDASIWQRPGMRDFSLRGFLRGGVVCGLLSVCFL
jgi:hypothetical protein